MKTILTEKQIEAYRLVSGEFQSLPTKVAADLMGISIQAFNRLLKRAEKVAPSLFPILNKQEADVKALLVIGYTDYDIANQLGVSLGRFSQLIGSVNNKRGTACGRPVKTIRYASYLDSQIARKF